MADIKRIAFLCHPYHRGGVTRWMVDAAALAAQDGFETWFVTVEPSKEFYSSGGRETMVSLVGNAHKNIRVVCCSVGYEFEFGVEDYRAMLYSKLISANVPAGTPVIVSDDSAVWKGAANVAHTHPMVGVLHCDDKYYYEIGKQYRDQMSLCVAVSERVKRVFEEQCSSYDAARVFAIPCGIHLHQFVPHQANQAFTRLVFVGRFNDHQKRAHDLVAICSQLHESGFAFRLDIAGNDEPSRVEFTGKFAARGVGEFVTFHGWQTAGQVQQLLNKSDVLLLTSNFEGTPLVMMEALAAGCGFVGTRVSGIEDYEHHELAKDCLGVFAVGDIADAVYKIKQVAKVPVPVRETAARSLAESAFSMRVCMDRYYAAIQCGITEAVKAADIQLTMAGITFSRLLAFARHMKMKLTR